MARSRLKVAGSQDLVLLVHGSHAASPADGGELWWQCDSRTWRELCRRLPADMRLQQRGEVFHWTGENSERARIKAAHELLRYLTELERRAQAYHLVGHGHGGSVIWYALRLAESRGVKLTRMRTWATVGTPFLHYRPNRVFNSANLCNLLLALMLALPLWHFSAALLALLTGRAGGLSVSAEGGFLLPRPGGWSGALWAGPLHHLLEGLGVPVRWAAESMTVGTFAPGGSLSLSQYFFQTHQGLVLLGLGLAAALVVTNVLAFLVGLATDMLQLRSDQRRDRMLMQHYRDRWLGLWSPDDEEINGLRSALQHSSLVIPKVASWRRTLLCDHVGLLTRPYYWVLAPLFNIVLRPVLQVLFRGMLARAALGDNRPGARVARVGVAPELTARPDRFPPIPEWLNRRLVESANSQLREVVPDLRQMLMAPAVSGSIDRLGHWLSGRELVHTSYFEHSEILDLLVMHMAWSVGKLDVSAQRGGAKRELIPWLGEFKRQVGQELQSARGRTPHDASFAPPPPHIGAAKYNTAKSKRRLSARL